MCLILLAWQKHPQYPLIVAANRDEYYRRRAASADFLCGEVTLDAYLDTPWPKVGAGKTALENTLASMSDESAFWQLPGGQAGERRRFRFGQ